MQIVELLVSPVHRFEGRPSDGPVPAEPGELVEEITVREGLGVVGDRYFGKGSIRCVPLTDGVLRLGPVQVFTADRIEHWKGGP
ncbi:hypothetical protein [Kineosporia babensis]|uniref:MOSC domain-containing protein n=1 Tax=Kineosporia babensis TaxID=499548 RepID=A0A9X1NMA8_9ACTN|nr:hypothetical protein [Kineosporia babensis]MCD5316715.1 hypothetical protein [Kineosporia babensis]